MKEFFKFKAGTKMKKVLWIVALVTPLTVCLSGCFETVERMQQEGEQQIFYDLNSSTDIILAVLKKGDLAKLLEDTDPDKIDTLIKNVSPALMAFEAEVLSCTLPVAVCYYADKQRTRCQKLITELHHNYPDIKYVLVDVEKLYSVAQQSAVEQTPTFMLINEREEQARFNEPFDLDAIKKALANMQDA